MFSYSVKLIRKSKRYRAQTGSKIKDFIWMFGFATSGFGDKIAFACLVLLSTLAECCYLDVTQSMHTTTAPRDKEQVRNMYLGEGERCLGDTGKILNIFKVIFPFVFKVSILKYYFLNQLFN